METSAQFLFVLQINESQIHGNVQDTRHDWGDIRYNILSKKSRNSKIVDGMESVKFSYRTQKNCSLLII